MITTKQFAVYGKPRSAGEGAERELLATHSDHDSALTFAAQHVLNNLFDLHKFDHSAKDLFDLWMEKGVDVTIEPDQTVPFSPVNFARLMVLQLTLDYSHPLLLEITCQDTLIMPSGVAAPPKEWTFYVKAPKTYENGGEDVEGLLKRATEVVYEEMSYKAMAAEGSSYKLLDMKARQLSEAEADVLAANADKETIYYVQNDGSFSKVAPKPPEG